MKILFVGDSHSNAGPANVNKRLMENLPANYCLLTARKAPAKAAELFRKLCASDVLVLSGITRIGMLALGLSRLTGTKSIYIMHGCAAYEAQVNGRKPDSDIWIEREKKILRDVHLILPVSRTFSRWVKAHYRPYEHKVAYLFNGIDRPEGWEQHTEGRTNTVIAVGGDRATKNNALLSEAVEEMGFVNLRVCGKIHAKDFKFQKAHTQYLDLIPQEGFYQELRRAKLFVLNSVFEPFSLSVMDALHCGCSVLVSRQAGIGDLLALEESDTVFDPMDKKELQDKIQYLLEHPNNERLLSHLQYDALSYAKRVEELTGYCESLLS